MPKSNINPRINDLLLEVADDLDELRYLDGNFMVEHDVDADDCIGMMKLLSSIVRGYVLSPAAAQNALILTGVNVLPGSQFSTISWEQAANTILGKQLDAALDKMKGAADRIIEANKKEGLS